jgi:hypothetical protein
MVPMALQSLGLLTLRIGPDIGTSCQKGDAAVNGIAYEVYQQPAYDSTRSFRQARSTLPDMKCQQWLFLDANTGQEIGAISPPLDLSARARTLGS